MSVTSCLIENMCSIVLFLIAADWFLLSLFEYDSWGFYWKFHILNFYSVNFYIIDIIPVLKMHM